MFIPGAQYSPLYNRKINKDLPLSGGNRMWDGMQYPGVRDRKTGNWIFGRGLFQKVLSDFHVHVRKMPPASLSIVPPVVDGLRDYQQEALDLIFSKKWGRIALPTNAGKGAIIGLAARTLAHSGCRALILCDELAPYNALKEQITQWAGAEPAMVSEDANSTPPTHPIVLAMLPTLYARTRTVKKRKSSEKRKAETEDSFIAREERAEKWREWVKGFHGVLVDEGDKASSTSFQEVLALLENTHIRVGFSGTFMESDQMTPEELTLSEMFGPVLLRQKNMDMVERGISARPFVELIPYSHQIDYPSKEEWQEMKGPERRKFVYDMGVTFNTMRHQCILSLLDPNEPNAIIVNYIDHGRNLANTLPNSRFLYGEDSKDVREEVLGQFKRGDFQNLVVSKILDRGTNDLGYTVGLIFASGQGSPRQTLQRIGRGLRRAGGKEFLFLKDILDRGDTYFETASLQRVALYNEEGFEVSIRA